MENLGIVIIGRGKMATALGELCQKRKVRYYPFNDIRDVLIKQSSDVRLIATHGVLAKHNSDLINLVAVHFGSGKQLVEALEVCERARIPLIQGSTGQELPEEVAIPVINAPNLSLPIVKAMQRVVPALAATFCNMEGMNVSLTESHQASKEHAPGTAQKMAETLGINLGPDDSIRKIALQLLLGVPPEFLDGHAYHFITIEGLGVKIELSTKVHGRRTYAEGALVIADWLTTNFNKLGNRVVPITEVLELMEG